MPFDMTPNWLLVILNSDLFIDQVVPILPFCRLKASRTPVDGKTEELEIAIEGAVGPIAAILKGFPKEDAIKDDGKWGDLTCTHIKMANATLNILRIRYSFLIEWLLYWHCGWIKNNHAVINPILIYSYKRD